MSWNITIIGGGENCEHRDSMVTSAATSGAVRSLGHRG